MLKGICFSLPSAGVDNTLRPVLERLGSLNYEITCYNSEAFRPKGESSIQFKAYPAWYTGYQSQAISQDILYFSFGCLLVDTAASIMDWLIEEVEREKPDFILHSHLAGWGKLVARYFNIPAVSLLATYVMDEQIMLPQLQKLKRGEGPNLNSIREGKTYYTKMRALHDRLGLGELPAIWDTYINEERFNVSMILGDLQPRKELVKPHFKFAGLPMQVEREEKQGYVYVALGTVFNANLDFYKLCIKVLHQKKLKGILSVGKKIDIRELGAVPDSIQVEQHVDQIAVLKKASVFITHGGPPSVQEGVCTLTPMIVTPRIVEQRLVGERVEELGIGFHLTQEQPTEADLGRALDEVLKNYPYYVANLESVVAKAPALPAAETACMLIDQYLQAELKSNPVC